MELREYKKGQLFSVFVFLNKQVNSVEPNSRTQLPS